jgi:ABC-type lipopolysaccharide export system ATPase subunit
LAVAERGYLLQHGEIVASGPIADLRDNRLMHELYLGQGNRLRRTAPPDSKSQIADSK